MDNFKEYQLPFRVLADGVAMSPKPKNGFVVNRRDQVVFIGTPEMCKFIVDATATMLEEIEALKTWRSSLAENEDITQGIDISISKIETCLNMFPETAA